MRRAVGMVVAGILLAGCSEQAERPGHLIPPPVGRAAPGPETDMRAFRAIEFGFSLEYPREITFTRSFQRDYLGPGAWKVFAPTNSRGQPVAALVLPGSDRRAAGELRVGVSTQSADVARCTEIPPQGLPDTRAQVEIDGVPFLRFDAQGSVRNNHMQVRAHRGVYNRHCYAIDLIVVGDEGRTGTQPATAPFSSEEAWARLQQLLGGFSFIRRD